MQKHNNDDILQQWVEFYNDYYRNEIGRLAQRYPKDQQSLRINFNDLYSFNPDLADDLRNHPEQILEYASEALTLVDLPADISLDSVRVRVTGLSDHHIMGVGEIRADHRGNYVGLYGHISRVTACRPKITTAAFECQRCGTLTRISQSDGDYQEPHECVGCERQGPFKINYDTSEFVDQRKIQLKQPPEDSENGEGDKITVYLQGDAADPPEETLESRVGEDAVIYGYIKLDQRGNNRQKSPVFDTYLVGLDYEFERETDDIDIEEHEEEFKTAANSPNVYHKFLHSMSPDIYPYGRWPLALKLGAVYLMGGVRVDPADGSTYRGDIHIGVVGPPGIGKSKFSQNIADLSPGCEHRSATGLSSDVGLTAAAVQDDFTEGDGWVLKPGVLPRAQDHAILDEADKTSAQLSKMNDALEGQQMASIDKGGISAKLKTRVGLLAMANPDGGRWDENAGIKEQVNVDESLWSRFDGIVLLQDEPDEKEDEELATHVLNNYEENLARQQTNGDSGINKDVPVSWDAMKAWVKYARENITPKPTEEAKEMLRDYYVEIRNDDSFADNSHPTPRKLEAGIRFSTAFAKIRLSNRVSETDVKMAIELSKALLGQTLYGGELDGDVFTEAMEKSQKERRDAIKSVIQNEAKTPEEIAKEIGGDVGRVQSELDKLHRRTNPARVMKKAGNEYKWIR